MAPFFKIFLSLGFVLFAVISPAFSEELAPEVLDLLEKNPFPEHPPKFIRAILDNYTFTNPKESEQSGAIWNREPLAIYCPPASLR